MVNYGFAEDVITGAGVVKIHGGNPSQNNLRACSSAPAVASAGTSTSVFFGTTESMRQPPSHMMHPHVGYPSNRVYTLCIHALQAARHLGLCSVKYDTAFLGIHETPVKKLHTTQPSHAAGPVMGAGIPAKDSPPQQTRAWNFSPRTFFPKKCCLSISSIVGLRSSERDCTSR